MQTAKSWKKIKGFILEILSFSTPQARVVSFSSIFLVLAIVPTELLKYSPIPCIYEDFLLPLIFGGQCPTTGLFAGCHGPSCGITRGMSRLLHGDFIGAWNFNKIVFVVFFVMLFILVKDVVILYKVYNNNKKLSRQ